MTLEKVQHPAKARTMRVRESAPTETLAESTSPAGALGVDVNPQINP
jgi:hypothetical protein